MKYNINIDQLVKIWQNLSVTVDFDGTEEELNQYLKEKKGSIYSLNPDYHDTQFLLDTEEHLDKYEIQSIEEA
jgi:hypothetical protein